MGFKPSNLATPAFVFKFVELVFVFIVFMIFRCGASGDLFFWGTGPVPYNPPSNTTTTASTASSPKTTASSSTASPTTTTTTTQSPASTTKAKSKSQNSTQSEALTQNPVKANKSDSTFIEKNELVDKNPAYDEVFKMSERAENDLVFGTMTSAGYFYITIILMIGIVLGDNARMSLFLFNLFGFFFFIAIGSEQIDIAGQHSQGKHTANGMGAMAILTSFVFLIDTVFVVRDMTSNKE